MPTNSLHAFYMGVLEDPQLPASLQHRVYDFARATSSNGLIRALAAHPALVEDLDARFAESDRAAMVRAWMSRPGRDPAAIAARIDGEQRVTVLASIAELEELDDEAFAQLAARDHQRVATALLNNPSTPEAQLVAASATVARYLQDKAASAGGFTRSLNDKLETLRLAVSCVPGAATAVAETTTHPRVLAIACEGPYLSDSAASALLDRMMDYTLSEAERTRDSWRSYDPAIDVMHGLTALLDGPVRSPALEDRARSYIRSLRIGANDHYRKRSSKQLEAVLARPAGTSRSSNNRVEAAAEADSLDAEQLESLANDVLASGPTAAVVTLARAPNVRGDLLLRLMQSQHINWRNASLVLAAKQRDPVAYGQALAASRRQFGQRVLDRCSDPSAALLAGMRALAQLGRTIPSGALESPLLTVDMVMQGPAGILSQDLPAQTRRLVTSIIEDHLGTNRMAWDTFDGLYADCEGSLAELLELTLALHGGTSATDDQPDQHVAPATTDTAGASTDREAQLALSL